jgi:uncharacterized protein with NRDE domain
MCTLACWIGSHPWAPLVVAANRDERLGRPSRGPFLWPGTPRLVAPRDEVAGGTWWALNQHGLFVALTNRAGANTDPGRRSRGQLVLDVARYATLVEAAGLLRRLEPGAYNGFHLLATDGVSGVLAVDDGEKNKVSRVPAGFYVVTERSFAAAETSRDERVRELLTGFPDVEGLQTLLRQHDPDPFQSLCVHLPGIDYGTRSSTILAFGGSAPTLRYAPGPPCTTDWRNMSGLLAELVVRPEPKS